MLEESFPKELALLRRVKEGASFAESLPDLINHLIYYYTFDGLNPILIGKIHPLTLFLFENPILIPNILVFRQL